MRAVVEKTKTFSLLSPLPSRTLISSFRSLCTGGFSSERGPRWKRASRNAILGPDLPDVWNLSDSPPSDPPVPKTEEAGQCFTTVIDGKSMAEKMRLVISEEVRMMKRSIGKVPGLAVVLVGQRRDSKSYVRFKIKACKEVGIMSLLAEFPEDCNQDEVLRAVSTFNDSPLVHGILVQLPLPKHMDEEKVLSGISLDKDVDGFHPLNMGNLALSGREPLFIPCASKACIEVLLRSGVELKGKKVVVVGRSKVAGLPISLLLQRHHATVTVVHALTNNPEAITCDADIVISAAGVPNLIRRSWLKPGAIVIDVGTNPVEDPREEHGYRLTGDVCYEEALQVASMITPVPGGVGPVTIAMLLCSTLESAKRIYGLQ